MRVLVVSCHPCEESFVAHVRAEALDALAPGNEVRHLDLYDEVDPDAAPADLAWAETLVLIYPTWWSSMPAPLVDWVDRCLSARERYPNLAKVVAVTTHGSSWPVNAIEGEVGRKVVMRGLRRHAHPRCKARWLPAYNIDRSTPEQRRKYVDKVRRKLARLR